MKNRSITVQGTEVGITNRHEQDYISLTDMVKNFDGGSALIEQWLKARHGAVPGRMGADQQPQF